MTLLEDGKPLFQRTKVPDRRFQPQNAPDKKEAWHPPPSIFQKAVGLHYQQIHQYLVQTMADHLDPTEMSLQKEELKHCNSQNPNI